MREHPGVEPVDEGGDEEVLVLLGVERVEEDHRDAHLAGLGRREQGVDVERQAVVEEQPARADVEAGEALVRGAELADVEEARVGVEPRLLRLVEVVREGREAQRRAGLDQGGQRAVEHRGEARPVVGVEIEAEQPDHHGRRPGDRVRPLGGGERPQARVHRVGAEGHADAGAGGEDDDLGEGAKPSRELRIDAARLELRVVERAGGQAAEGSLGVDADGGQPGEEGLLRDHLAEDGLARAARAERHHVSQERVDGQGDRLTGGVGA